MAKGMGFEALRGQNSRPWEVRIRGLGRSEFEVLGGRNSRPWKREFVTWANVTEGVEVEVGGGL